MLLGKMLTSKASSLDVHSRPELLQKIVRPRHRSLSCPIPLQKAKLDHTLEAPYTKTVRRFR